MGLSLAFLGFVLAFLGLSLAFLGFVLAFLGLSLAFLGVDSRAIVLSNFFMMWSSDISFDRLVHLHTPFLFMSESQMFPSLPRCVIPHSKVADTLGDGRLTRYFLTGNRMGKRDEIDESDEGERDMTKRECVFITNTRKKKTMGPLLDIPAVFRLQHLILLFLFCFLLVYMEMEWMRIQRYNLDTFGMEVFYLDKDEYHRE